MELSPRGKITKAKLGGKSFLYNPNALQDTISVTYSDFKSPGMTYPILVYSGGERRTLTFDIYLNDKVEDGITRNFIAHLHSFIPPASTKGYQFKKPRRISFAYGWMVKDCWLTNMDIQYTAFSPKLQPIEATVSVTLAVIQ